MRQVVIRRRISPRSTRQTDLTRITASHSRNNRTDHGCELHGVGATSISFSGHLPDSCANGARRAAIAACSCGAHRAARKRMRQLDREGVQSLAALRSGLSGLSDGKRPLRRCRVNEGGRQIRFEAVRQIQGDAG